MIFRFVNLFIFFVRWASSLAQSAFIFLFRPVLAWFLRVSAQIVWNSWYDAWTWRPRHVISQTFLSLLLSCLWLLKTLSNSMALWKYLPSFTCTKGLARPHSACASPCSFFQSHLWGCSLILIYYSWTCTIRDLVYRLLIINLMFRYWFYLFCWILLVLLRLFGSKLITIATRFSTSSPFRFHDYYKTLSSTYYVVKK